MNSVKKGDALYWSSSRNQETQEITVLGEPHAREEAKWQGPQRLPAGCTESVFAEWVTGSMQCWKAGVGLTYFWLLFQAPGNDQ